MQITIDTANPLTELDRGILRSLLSDVTPVETPVEKPVRKKPGPKPKAEAEAEAEAEADTDEGPTLNDAVNRATELLGEGKAAVVKKALKDLDVERVGKLEGSQIAEFLTAIS